MRMDVKISQQAMTVVRPTNEQIGPWQARAAHLQVMAEKRAAKGRRDQRIADEAVALLAEVEMQRHRLSERVERLPDDVAGSTRLDDTARALQSVAQVLERVRDLMGAGATTAELRQTPAGRAGRPVRLRP